MRYLMLIAALLVFTGCSKLSKEKYDKLKIGMPYEQVVSILGQATHCDAFGGMSDCTWGDEKEYIKVKFVSEKVMFTHSQGLK